MKTKRVHFKVIFCFIVLFILSFNSCDPMESLFDCKKCSKSGQKTVEVCSQRDIDDYESSGWTCK